MLNAIIYSKDTEFSGVLYNIVAVDFNDYNPYRHKTWKSIKGALNFADKHNVNIIKGKELALQYKKANLGKAGYKLHEEYIEKITDWWDR